MPARTVSQTRSLRANPRHYPRKVLVMLYNSFTREVARKPLPGNPQSILIQAQEKLGDAVLLMPLLKALNTRFKKARIEVLCSRHNQYLFQAVPFIADTYVYPSELSHLKQKLAGKQYDLFYNPKDHPSITAFRVARFVQAEVTVCLSHPRHDRHYNFSLPNRGDVPVVEKNGELLKAYGVEFPLANYFPLPDVPDRTQKKRIALNLSSGGIHRKWPHKNWAELIQKLMNSERDLHLALFAMGEDQTMGEQLKQQFGSRIEYPLSSRNLLEAGTILRLCKMLISPDTALIHVSAAVGTPVVGLYTGDIRNQQRYQPWGVDHELVISSGLGLSDISPVEVKKAYGHLKGKLI